MFGFPLLLIPLAICNIIVFLMPGVSFQAPLATLPLMSGVAWTVTLSDSLLTFGVLMLMFEVIKGARPNGKYFTDHFLALLVFAGAAAEFVLLPPFGTSTYFLLTLLALVDFLSGIALRTRRPRRAVAEPVTPTATLAPEPAATPSPAANREPIFAPAPVPPVVPETATPVPPPQPAPSDATAHVEPIVPEKAAETGQDARSPEIVSPGLAPGNAAHPPSPESSQR